MLKKLFKTIFILTLCFGCVLNTQAAISQVSDGSSFITKAEFKGLVNEASGRIEALELHVDTQINTLVESFLLRNNIWHPQKQTLNNNTEIELIPTTITLSSNRASGTATIVSRRACINQVKKSGLMIISLYYRAKITTGVANSYKWGYQGNMGSAGNWQSDNGTELVVKFFEETKSGEDLFGNPTYNSAENKYTCLIGSTQGAKKSYGTSDAGYVCVIALSPKEVMIPAYFFVTKNSRISWNAEQLYKFSNTSSCLKVCDGSNSGQNISCWIQDPMVY